VLQRFGAIAGTETTRPLLHFRRYVNEAPLKWFLDPLLDALVLRPRYQRILFRGKQWLFIRKEAKSLANTLPRYIAPLQIVQMEIRLASV